MKTYQAFPGTFLSPYPDDAQRMHETVKGLCAFALPESNLPSVVPLDYVLNARHGIALVEHQMMFPGPAERKESYPVLRTPSRVASMLTHDNESALVQELMAIYTKQHLSWRLGGAPISNSEDAREYLKAIQEMHSNADFHHGYYTFAILAPDGVDGHAVDTEALQAVNKTFSRNALLMRGCFDVPAEWYLRRIVGLITVYDFSPYNRSAKIGYSVAINYGGRGYATSAVALVLQRLLASEAGIYSYEESGYFQKPGGTFVGCGMMRVSASVVENNHVSGRVLKKLGFTQEGRERSAYTVAVHFSGEPSAMDAPACARVDVVTHSLLADEVSAALSTLHGLPKLKEQADVAEPSPVSVKAKKPKAAAKTAKHKKAKVKA